MSISELRSRAKFEDSIPHAANSKVMYWAANEIDRLRAIVATLPKCYRLVDGELVQDCPVTPGMVMYFYFGPSYRIELYKRTVRTIGADDWLTWVEKGPERGRMSEDCCNSREAAEALAAGKETQ